MALCGAVEKRGKEKVASRKLGGSEGRKGLTGSECAFSSCFFKYNLGCALSDQLVLARTSSLICGLSTADFSIPHGRMY